MDVLLQLLGAAHIDFFNIGIALATFGVTRIFTKQYAGIGIFIRTSLLMVQMAKWYFDTHPDAKAKMNSEVGTVLRKVHLQKRTIEHYIEHKTGSQTGGLG